MFTVASYLLYKFLDIYSFCDQIKALKCVAVCVCWWGLESVDPQGS